MSHSTPKLQTWLAGAAISKGKAVKKGADDEHVIECTSNTDKAIGIAYMNAEANTPVEVALPGGGSYGLLAEDVSMGDALTPSSSGLAKTLASGNQIIAYAEEDGLAGQIKGVRVNKAIATAADQ